MGGRVVSKTGIAVDQKEKEDRGDSRMDQTD